MSDQMKNSGSGSEPKSELVVIDLEQSRNLFVQGGLKAFVDGMNADLETHGVVQLNDANHEPLGYIASPKLILQNLGRALASGKIEGEQPQFGYRDGKIVIEVPHEMLRKATGDAILQGLLTPA